MPVENSWPKIICTYDLPLLQKVTMKFEDHIHSDVDIKLNRKYNNGVGFHLHYKFVIIRNSASFKPQKI